MSKDDGGSAFPIRSRWDSGQENFDLEDCGMTLRDYFAAHAIDAAAMTSTYNVAARAYAVADAMLEVRNKEGGK
jgi:hypothetical protein